ncbi:MAG: LpxL/LpxP family Kdo(2)-lipid IV(A) lauroyl/palmitoleoyl acyltransferase [Gammaproteobacteria bacterium]|nr:LpxL/LpxP family Kdo(2)-lipid IV(A) lauroyl/palmitoleoyl acyltransferase [Gammaproteobacteria bacterium]
MTPPSLLRFWQPRFWPTWLGLGLLRLLVLLPLRGQRAAGRLLGRLGLLLARKRRAIAATNLRLCFPGLGEGERRRLLRRHFDSLGLQLIELGMALWASDARVRRLWRIDGLEHLQDALAGGRGAILLSGHFATVEFSGRRLCMDVPGTAAIYRPNRNPLMDALLLRMRIRTIRRLVPKDSIRKLIRCLGEGNTVWYAPDQSFRRKGSVLVPFFGVPAMSSGALSGLARVSRAPVVPYLATRRADGSGYDIRIEPALEDFPGNDPAADVLRINGILERHIREAPEQYYWVHRRFKGRPAPYPDPYAEGEGAAPATPAA